MLKKIYHYLKNRSLISDIAKVANNVSGNSVKTSRIAGKNIIITGGGLFNKGGEAMTFTTVDALRKYFPDKEIYLFVLPRDYERDPQQKERYQFKMLPWDFPNKFGVVCGFNRFSKENKYYGLNAHIQQVLGDAFLMVDISGFALSSQWPWQKTMNYLLNLIAAKKFAIEHIILPQSFGPFEYPKEYQGAITCLLKKVLPWSKKIYVREEDGLSRIAPLTPTNVQFQLDIVLQGEDISPEAIYKSVPKFKTFQIPARSVGVIPNQRVNERLNPEKMSATYKDMINKLLTQMNRVYILRYSDEDKVICQDIKAMFMDETRVVLIEEDLSCLESEQVLKQFQFLVASRYHSVVFAFKNAVPVIAIGWAVKYQELLKHFKQSDYYFDCRAGIDWERLSSMLSQMMINVAAEKGKIQTQLDALSKNNLFKAILEKDLA
jgi:polysaccharide pyruvyl transferase WcaK-like protein